MIDCVACEVCAKTIMLCLLARITSAARVNVEAVAREAIKEIGYNDPGRRFNAGRRIGSEFIQPPGRGHRVWCGTTLVATDNFVDPNAGEARLSV